MDVTGHDLAERYSRHWEETRPHLFVPRRYGSPEACQFCGAREADPIHDGPWRLPRREADDGGEVIYG